MAKSFSHWVREFEPYLRRVAFKCRKQSRLYDAEDLYQEMHLVLFNCCNKYPDLPDNEFKWVYIRSINNMLATLARSKSFKNDRFTNRISPIMYKLMWQHQSSDDFYRVGIDELTESLDDESKDIVNYMTSSESRGRWKCGGFARTVKKAKQLMYA